MEQFCVLVITVNNHPGVMSHVTGLFARRAFNLEGILCGPLPEADRSRMYLLVREDERLEQIFRQLEKLYDVLSVRLCRGCDPGAFFRLDAMMAEDVFQQAE